MTFAMTSSVSEYMQFFDKTMPARDKDCCERGILQQFAIHGAMLRQQIPWCRSMDEDIFRHYVLYYRVNDEDIEPHRELFFEELYPLVKEKTLQEAVLETNWWCHTIAAYQEQDSRTASPAAIYASGIGRCGELSTFLVSALRSVGIAARQVYVPRWSHCDDNHAWVEAWVDGRWRFLGACEPDIVLDKGWFNVSASRAMLVHSRRFDDAAEYPQKLEQVGAAVYFNETRRYAFTMSKTIQVTYGGKPKAGVLVQLSILNAAVFTPIVSLWTDEAGMCSAELAHGTVMLEVMEAGRHKMQLVSWGQMHGRVVIELKDKQVQLGKWECLTFYPPKAVPIDRPRETPQQRKERESRISVGEKKYQSRVAAYIEEAALNRYPDMQDEILNSRANASTIIAFLDKDDGFWRKRLIKILAKKDLRDISLAVLEDHYTYAIPFCTRYDDALFADYILSPRIGWETLTCWREKLSVLYLADDVHNRQRLIQAWFTLKKDVSLVMDRSYPNLLWTPDAVYENRRADKPSLGIFYVAWLRSQGIPARLSSIDGITPEFWDSDKKMFYRVDGAGIGELKIKKRQQDNFQYGTNWSISCLQGNSWVQCGEETLEYKQDGIQLMLPSGRYRLVCTVRLPDGHQRARYTQVDVCENTTQEISIALPDAHVSEVLDYVEIPELVALTDANKSALPLGIRLLLWMNFGAEPTEHLVSELLAQREKKALQNTLHLFIHNESNENHPSLLRLRKSFPHIVIERLDFGTNPFGADSQLCWDAENLPIGAVFKDKSVVFSANGYNVGIGTIYTEIIEYLIAGE